MDKPYKQTYVDSEPFAKMIADYFGIELKGVEELRIICRSDKPLMIEMRRLGKTVPGKELTGTLPSRFIMKETPDEGVEE